MSAVLRVERLNGGMDVYRFSGEPEIRECAGTILFESEDDVITRAAGVNAEVVRSWSLTPGKSGYDVQLHDGGDHKIQVIKVIRNHTGRGLKEAKEAAETPGTLAQDMPEREAFAFLKDLNEAGAVAEVK